ncbi:MAG TPA: hypothetical protein VHN14_02670, partial [Kofleriaceae bacterium]|nr:hypothetical protein [Kofleriaceae bacterium]
MRRVGRCMGLAVVVVALGGALGGSVATGGCGPPPGPAPVVPHGEGAGPGATSGAEGSAASPGPGSASDPSQDERLAAIQKAMNELDEAAQQCWAAAATERFDIEGELSVQIDVAPGRSRASVVHDTVHNPRLVGCVVQLLAAYRWAPPLH